MITPYGFDLPRILVELIVYVYTADILIKYKTTNLDRIKTQLVNAKNNFIGIKNEFVKIAKEESSSSKIDEQNPTIINLSNLAEEASEQDQELLSELNNLFVQITFCSETRRTAAISFSSKPVWNETFKFAFQFPSLVRLFKIELCSESRFTTTVLATEYLDIDSISDYRTNDHFFPTLGPSYIDLYSEPENLRVKPFDLAEENIQKEQLNRNEVEIRGKVDKKKEHLNNTKTYVPISGSTPGGGEYIARLMMGIKSVKAEPYKNKCQDLNNQSEILNSVSNALKKSKKSFTLFCLISECIICDSRYQGNLSFQICIG